MNILELIGGDTETFAYSNWEVTTYKPSKIVAGAQVPDVVAYRCAACGQPQPALEHGADWRSCERCGVRARRLGNGLYLKAAKEAV